MTGLGDIIGSYRVIRPLASGAMGTVYEVEHVDLKVRYALKAFTFEGPDAEAFRKRFLAEGRILARLRHPNVVRVFDLGVHAPDGAAYFVMDLVLSEGGKARTLADVEPGAADEDRIRRWFAELCEALAYVHAQGIVHRDIKLNNILLAEDGRAVLTDFGISRFTDEKVRTAVDLAKTIVTGDAAHVMGTAGYLAPELRQGAEATRASDVYALGVALFRLLTNVWYDPSLATAPQGRARLGTNVLQLLECLDGAWAEVLPGMLANDPSARPLDLASLPARVTPQEGVRHRTPPAWAWATAVVLAAVGVAAWRIFRPTPSAPVPVSSPSVAEEFRTAFSADNLLEGLR